MIPATMISVVNTSNCSETTQQKRVVQDRDLKYFMRSVVQSAKPVPNVDTESRKILLCGRDVTPKPLEHPQFAIHLDRDRITLKKMEVAIQPPASEIIPVQEILASKTFVQYYPEEVMIPLKGTAVHQFLQNKPQLEQEEKGLELLRDITLDELTKNEEIKYQNFPAKEEESRISLIDDSSLQKHHEYEDLPENKILIQLQESKTLCLLEINSVLRNITGRNKKVTKHCKVEECSPEGQFAVSDENPIIETFNEKETQTIEQDKTDGEVLTTKTQVQETGVMATNATIYDDIKEYEDREARNLLDEINKQKKRLNDLLMDPQGPLKIDSNSIQCFLKTSYSEMTGLNPKLILHQILEFIKEFEESYIKKDLCNPFTFLWETKKQEKSKNVLEKAISKEELEAIKELKEFSSSLDQRLKMSPEDEYEEITKNKNFLLALQAVEDCLIYEDEFPNINIYFNQDNETEKEGQRELSIAYNLEILWEFSDEQIKNQAVTCIAWSENNSGFFASGYGKWQFKNNMSYSGPGYLCLWPVVLPTKRPIWKLSFESSVVSICFHPYITYCLAIGLSNGDVYISDINKQTTETSCVSNLKLADLYGPAYSLSWFRGSYNSNPENLFLVSGGKKGALYQWNSPREYLISEKILSVPPVYGEIKGIKTIEPEHQLPFCFMDTSVTCITKCVKGGTKNIQANEDKIFYLVATDDGCVHQCSLDYYHHHLNYFRAHNGPINSLAVNYYSDCVFLTCGADFTVRIWALGVQYPLITLEHGLECVECAVWSRSHPTIIASISGRTLYMWDIQRKPRDPVTKFQNPYNLLLTSISFSLEGQNILIGDIEGNLLVYHVKDLPIVPHFPEKALVNAIKHALVYDKNLLKELESIGPPFEKEQIII